MFASADSGIPSGRMVRVVSLSGAVCSWLLREKSAPRERKETCRGSQGGEKGTGAFSAVRSS